ncbi:MAG: formate dehydrogenase accessory sulfurtransferase FdhD [Chloroflexi bacterium]|nr:formate dehydrogenase accessory sulfurtransferase FdhD [Chloroflexota bacterium]
MTDHVARASTWRVVTLDGDTTTRRLDTLAGEEPLQIRAAGPGQEALDIAVTMRTPGHEHELAVGFLVTEGLATPTDIDRWTIGDPATDSRPDDTITVHLRRPLDPATIRERQTVATASCGICGTASIADIARRCEALPDGPRIDPAVLPGLPSALRAAQETFESTGGLHASGLFDPAGRLLLAREDVGRHNALDTLVGAAAIAGDLPLHGTMLLVSGRVSFELVQKAAMAGIPVLVAVGAPTDLAVATAERLGMTLIGFLRGDRCNVYSRPDRLGLAP